MDSTIDYKKLGARIRSARKAAGFTQEELSEMCSLSAAHIGHIERGSRIPSLDTLYRISLSLGVGIDGLLSDSPQSADATLLSVGAVLKGKDKNKVRSFLSAVKALADNIDSL